MADSDGMEMPKPAPQLRQLDFLVGTWELSGTTEDGPMGPAATLTGTETFEWMEGGFFLVHHWKGRYDMGGEELVDAGYEFFDYDPETGRFRTHYFSSFSPYDDKDSHYQGQFEGDALVLLGPARFVRRPNSDGTITYDCDFPGENGRWTPFMHAKLTKIG